MNIGYPRATGSGDFVGDLTNAVRNNPVSAALIGMGVLWLFTGGSRTSLFGAHRAAGTAYDTIRDGAERLGNTAHRVADSIGSSLSAGASNAAEAVAGVGSRTGETAEDAATRVGDTISAAASQVSDALSSSYQSIGSATGRAASALSEAGSSVAAATQAAQRTGYDIGRSVKNDLTELFERQPLLLGAVGLAIGAGLAAAVPTTEAENRVLGDASDVVKEEAKKLASEQMDKAKAMGSQAVEEVRREAESQGLTAAAATETLGSLAKKVKTVAETAREGVKNKLRQQ